MPTLPKLTSPKTEQMLVIERQSGGKDIRLLLQEAMDRNGGEMTKVAAEMGVTTATLYNWFAALGLQVRKVLIIGEPITA